MVEQSSRDGLTAPSQVVLTIGAPVQPVTLWSVPQHMALAKRPAYESGLDTLGSVPVSASWRAISASFMFSAWDTRHRTPKAASAVMPCRSISDALGLANTVPVVERVVQLAGALCFGESQRCERGQQDRDALVKIGKGRDLSGVQAECAQASLIDPERNAQHAAYVQPQCFRADLGSGASPVEAWGVNSPPALPDRIAAPTRLRGPERGRADVCGPDFGAPSAPEEAGVNTGPRSGPVPCSAPGRAAAGRGPDDCGTQPPVWSVTGEAIA